MRKTQSQGSLPISQALEDGRSRRQQCRPVTNCLPYIYRSPFIDSRYRHVMVNTSNLNENTINCNRKNNCNSSSRKIGNEDNIPSHVRLPSWRVCCVFAESFTLNCPSRVSDDFQLRFISSKTTINTNLIMAGSTAILLRYQEAQSIATQDRQRGIEIYNQIGE